MKNLINIDLVIEEYEPGDLGNKSGEVEYHLYCVPLDAQVGNERMILIDIFDSLEKATNARADLKFTAWVNFGQFINWIGRECYPVYKEKFVKLHLVN